MRTIDTQHRLAVGAENLACRKETERKRERKQKKGQTSQQELRKRSQSSEHCCAAAAGCVAGPSNFPCGPCLSIEKNGFPFGPMAEMYAHSSLVQLPSTDTRMCTVTVFSSGAEEIVKGCHCTAEIAGAFKKMYWRAERERERERREKRVGEPLALRRIASDLLACMHVMSARRVSDLSLLVRVSKDAFLCEFK